MDTQSITFSVGTFDPEKDQRADSKKMAEITAYSQKMKREHPKWKPQKLLNHVMKHFDIKVLIDDKRPSSTDSGK